MRCDYEHLEQLAVLEMENEQLREESERLKAEQDNAGFIPWRLAQDSLDEYAAQVADLQSRLSAMEEELQEMKEAADELTSAADYWQRKGMKLREENERLKGAEKAIAFRVAELKRENERLKDYWREGGEGFVVELESRLSAAEEELKLLRFAEPKEYANAKRWEARARRAEEVVEAAKALVRSGVLGGEEGDDIRDAIYRYEEGK